MVDLFVEKLYLINPFIVAIPSTAYSAMALLKGMKVLPGAVVVKYPGIHPTGEQLGLERFCTAVMKMRTFIPKDVKLWISMQYPGPFLLNEWLLHATELERAGADALEICLNIPEADGTIDETDNIDFILKAVKTATRIPVSTKLPVSYPRPVRVMDTAMRGGADTIGLAAGH